MLILGEDMKQAHYFTKLIVGFCALVTLSFALGACGPRVVSGNEQSLVVKNGPWYPWSKAETTAASHCETHGKQPSYEGGYVERGTLWYVYHFDCVDNS